MKKLYHENENNLVYTAWCKHLKTECERTVEMSRNRRQTIQFEQIVYFFFWIISQLMCLDS